LADIVEAGNHYYSKANLVLKFVIQQSQHRILNFVARQEEISQLEKDRPDILYDPEMGEIGWTDSTTNTSFVLRVDADYPNSPIELVAVSPPSKDVNIHELLSSYRVGPSFFSFFRKTSINSD
jgi:hypothetical protein